MDNFERVTFTGKDMYTQEQIKPLLDELVKEAVITLVPDGPYAQVVQANGAYKLADIEDAIAAYVDGTLPLAGAMVVAKDMLLGLPHDKHNEQEGGGR